MQARRIIVIGAGHNGLTCAAYLARGGYDVVVVEASDHVGGAADTREFADGFRVSGCAHYVYQLNQQVVQELGLQQHGLEYSARDLSTIALSPGEQRVTIGPGGLSGPVTERDRSGHQEFTRLTERFAGLLSRYLNQAPPRLANGTRKDRLTLARLGWDIRRLGRDDMRELLRVGAINIYDVLNEFFDSDLVKGAISLDAVLGTHMGPRSPNSVLTYLYRLAGNGVPRPGALALPRGGMGGIAAALERAARAAGVEIRSGTAVGRITVSHDRVSGVELTDGERLEAGLVVSSADPRTTVLSLLGARHCETGFVRRIHNLRCRGNAAKLHLALDGPPDFPGVGAPDLRHRLIFAPDMDYAERAFNPAKYGEYSTEPVMEIALPSMSDPSLAPEGKHVLSAIVQYAPYQLKAGWDDGQKQAFLDVALATLATVAPGIRDQIVAGELLTPADIEARYRISGGHWHHGELSLDQFMFVRPVPGATQYALPVDGLFLCGAGAHPGGGITGTPGRIAAQVIVEGGAA
ncbi:MAG: NAD(P)/FAD-dependent oxidoreductase [Xanthomonadales bacterium]|nr:NAD(P)/FAD-dependent oxidoreductase [Xanthomonadales bacterium]